MALLGPSPREITAGNFDPGSLNNGDLVGSINNLGRAGGQVVPRVFLPFFGRVSNGLVLSAWQPRQASSGHESLIVDGGVVRDARGRVCAGTPVKLDEVFPQTYWKLVTNLELQFYLLGCFYNTSCKMLQRCLLEPVLQPLKIQLHQTVVELLPTVLTSPHFVEHSTFPTNQLFPRVLRRLILITTKQFFYCRVASNSLNLSSPFSSIFSVPYKRRVSSSSLEPALLKRGHLQP